MKRISLILLLISFQIVTAQKAIHLNVKGNKIFTLKDFTGWLTEKNTEKEIGKIITKHLNQRGYYNSEIKNISIDSSASKDTLNIFFDILEGKQTTIRKISIVPENKIDSILYQKYFKPLENQIFYQINLENQIEKSLKYLENKGFPFSRIKIQSLNFSKDKDSNNVVDIYLEVKKDRLAKIDKIKILGNTQTNENVIINALRLQKGELYSQKRIDEIPLLLNKLRFFEPVEKPKFYFDSNEKGVLQITVKEKSTNNFDGILGYIPPAKNRDGYLTGFVNINLRNILGSGRAAGIKWQKENSLSQELQLKYLEPWLFNYPFNVNLYLYQRKQDSTFVLRKYGGSLEYLATENVTASLIAESESVIPALNIKSVKSSTSLNSGLKIQLDFRDDILVPQSGMFFSTLYKLKSKKDNLTTQKNTLQQYELDFEIYYTLFKNQTTALGVHAKEIIADSYEESDFFRLGGANSLRGYREQQFLGNRILWSNLEYRFLLSQMSYLFILYDVGYFLRNENKELNISKISGYKSAYGVGLSIDTALGIMRISYALASGNPFSEGLIHFGLLNEF